MQPACTCRPCPDDRDDACWREDEAAQCPSCNAPSVAIEAEKKRKRPVKSAGRALAECRRRKWTAGIVEKRTPRFGGKGGSAHDFLGFADVLALDGHDGVHAIQACVGSGDAAGHVEKFRADATVTSAIALWLARGNRLSIWSMRRVKLFRGSKAIRWKCRELRASLDATSGLIAWAEVPAGATLTVKDATGEA